MDEQPMPRAGTVGITALVIADLRERERVGIQTYGTTLQAHNGRDALRDLYEEWLDGIQYLKQVLVERDAMQDHRLISHREDAATLLAREWRVGKSTGRALYVGAGDHEAVGWMDTPELAVGVVERVNGYPRIAALTQEVQHLRGLIVGLVAGELTGGEALAVLVAYRLPEDAREEQ